MAYGPALLLSTDSYADAMKLYDIAGQSAETSFISITGSLVPGTMTVTIGFQGMDSSLRFLEENIQAIDGIRSVYH